MQHVSHPDVAFAIIPKHDFGWSRAYFQLLQGVAAAASAQTDFARLMFAANYSAWPPATTPGTAGEALRQWLTGINEKLHVVALGHGLMNDGLAESFFCGTGQSHRRAYQ